MTSYHTPRTRGQRTNMTDVQIESQLSEILRFFETPDAMKKQNDGIIQIKKSKGYGNIGISVVLFVLGALLMIWGGRGLYFWGGLLMAGSSVIFFFLSLVRVAKASQVTLDTDLVKTCSKFYSNAFCRKTSDFGAKDDQIVDVCEVIPVPVLDDYKKSGWLKFLETDKPISDKSIFIECTHCQKKSWDSREAFQDIPVSTKYREEYQSKETAETQNLIKNLFLKCEACGSVICYECLGYRVGKMSRFLCPVCGKATNGWSGLASRWMGLRNMCAPDQDVDFSISSLHADQSPRLDPRIVDVTIRLEGAPFGSLSLSNVALDIGGKWFLASPEPLLAGSRARRPTPNNRPIPITRALSKLP